MIAMMEHCFEANVLRRLSHIPTAIEPYKLHLVDLVENKLIEYTLIFLIVNFLMYTIIMLQKFMTLDTSLESLENILNCPITAIHS